MWKEVYKSTANSSRDANNKRHGRRVGGVPGVIFLLLGKQMVGRAP